MKEDNKRSSIMHKSSLLILVVILAVVFCARKDELQQAVEAIDKGDYSKGVMLLTRVLKRDSLNPRVHYNLSLAYAYLDSANQSFSHYLTLFDVGSDLKDDTQLREMLAHLLQVEPYASSPIPMKRLNQFKGTFSPDGQTVAVAAARRGIAHIYLAKLDGTGIERITQVGTNTDPDFSPTGEYIVFVSDRDGDEELFLYDVMNKHIERLTDNTAQDYSPSFSPDGQEIVFVSNMHDKTKWEIYKVNRVTKKVSRLTNNDYWDGFPKFSSDGKTIVFSSRRNGTDDIYVMGKNGGGQRVLYASAADDNDPLLIGENLFFKSNMTGEWEIYRFNTKNKRLLRLTYNNYPDWNPRATKDGTRLILARQQKKTWQLYWFNMDNPISAEFLFEKIKQIRALQ